MKVYSFRYSLHFQKNSFRHRWKFLLAFLLAGLLLNMVFFGILYAPNEVASLEDTFSDKKEWMKYYRERKMESQYEKFLGIVDKRSKLKIVSSSLVEEDSSLRGLFLGLDTHEYGFLSGNFSEDFINHSTQSHHVGYWVLFIIEDLRPTDSIRCSSSDDHYSVYLEKKTFKVNILLHSWLSAKFPDLFHALVQHVNLWQYHYPNPSRFLNFMPGKYAIVEPPFKNIFLIYLLLACFLMIPLFGLVEPYFRIVQKATPYFSKLFLATLFTLLLFNELIFLFTLAPFQVFLYFESERILLQMLGLRFIMIQVSWCCFLVHTYFAIFHLTDSYYTVYIMLSYTSSCLTIFVPQMFYLHLLMMATFLSAFFTPSKKTRKSSTKALIYSKDYSSLIGYREMLNWFPSSILLPDLLSYLDIKVIPPILASNKLLPELDGIELKVLFILLTHQATPDLLSSFKTDALNHSEDLVQTDTQSLFSFLDLPGLECYFQSLDTLSPQDILLFDELIIHGKSINIFMILSQCHARLLEILVFPFTTCLEGNELIHDARFLGLKSNAQSIFEFIMRHLPLSTLMHSTSAYELKFWSETEQSISLFLNDFKTTLEQEYHCLVRSRIPNAKEIIQMYLLITEI